MAASGLRGALLALSAACAAFALGLGATTASAAPIHPFLPDASLDGSDTPSGDFDKACGVAADSEGDVYVASAGNGAIEIFDSEGNYLTSIANANEPCGLAVDTDGNLYASEQATGNVVKYEPAEYPFAGAPAYGPADPVDESGEAKGIAVDPYDDRLYVARGDHVAAYDSTGKLGIDEVQRALVHPATTAGSFRLALPAEGGPGLNETQRLTRSPATGGTFRPAMAGDGGPGLNETQRVDRGFASGGAFTLSFEAQTTAPIPYDATAVEVEEALEELAPIGPGDVSVSAPAAGGSPWWVEFTGALAETDVPELVGDGSGLQTGGSKVISVAPFSHLAAPIPNDATAAELKEALEELAPIGPGNVSVSAPVAGGSPWWVEFTGALAETDVPLLGGDGSGLTGGGNSVTGEAVSDVTAPIPFDASHAQVQSALEGLAAIGSGNVSVSDGPEGARDHLIAFVGALAATDVDQLVADGTALVGGGVSTPGSGTTQGWDGRIGEGELTEATGVAAYTYQGASKRRYVAVADAETDEILVFSGSSLSSLALRSTIDGSETPDGSFGFGANGAYLTFDRGNCPKEVSDRACTAGHILVHDAAHNVVDEFEATGRYFAQISDPAIADARPTQTAVDRSGGPSDGRLYASSGDSPNAEVLAFGAIPTPKRAPLPEPISFDFAGAQGVTVDPEGNVLVSSGSRQEIIIRSESGDLLTTISDPNNPSDLAVDPTDGTLYVREDPSTGGSRVVAFEPDEYPIESGTEYVMGPIVEEHNTQLAIRGIDVNPANRHLLVARSNAGFARIVERESAEDGLGIIREVPNVNAWGVAVHGPSGDMAAAEHAGITSRIKVIGPNGSDVNALIDGTGSPGGSFPGLANARVDIEQSNGHLLVSKIDTRGFVEEFDGAGTFVGQIGPFVPVALPSDVAVDNSGGPSDGRVYVAYSEPGNAGVFAFGPLEFGQPPSAVTGLASEVGGGQATLNGTVVPNAALDTCEFEYLLADEFDANVVAEVDGFVGAAVVSCEQSLESIGESSDPVPVSVSISGLDPDARYRFRLRASNQFGQGSGDPAGVFGPPQVSSRDPLSILYSESTVRATVDPSGLQTTYRAEYGTSVAYDSSSANLQLGGGAGSSGVQILLGGLQQQTTYHYRVVAENEAGFSEGPDQTLTTLRRPGSTGCSNEALRAGASASLPDCRAYELASYADMHALVPYATTSGSGPQFPSRLSSPSSLVFFTDGSIPGTGGNGILDAHRFVRGADGWSGVAFGPGPAEGKGGGANQGVSADHGYSFWVFGTGTSLQSPAGFAAIGQGSEGIDPDAFGRYISPGADHIVFTSKAHLEPEAAAAGKEAIYERTPAGPTQVVSIAPNGNPLTEDATYMGTSEDGSANAFKVGGAMFVHREGETVKVADAPVSFAGFSSDGNRIFLASAVFGPNSPITPTTLSGFDLEAGSPFQIAPDSRYVNVSADGSRAYFTSALQLDGAEGEAGADNLYVWDGAGVEFVVVLDPRDLEEFGGEDIVDLVRWSSSSVSGPDSNGTFGHANSPARTTPGGDVLLFQSHAPLTGFDTGGHAQIYRYEFGVDGVLCVSCPQGSSEARAEAMLQDSNTPGVPTAATTVIPNVTEDGDSAFFESDDDLLPSDRNGVRDVYEWKAQGKGGCVRPDGCLDLLSTGRDTANSYLYGMSSDGHDVFVATEEKLVSADRLRSHSIYDARVGGGFPEPGAEEDCEAAETCRADPSGPPALPVPAGAAVYGGAAAERRSCGRSARRAKRLGAHAKRLRGAAKRARAPRRARQMRRRARRLAKRGAKLRGSTRRCRRANRRAAR